MQANHAKLADELAKTAIEKRSNDALQAIVQWFQSLPSEQRNAVIGALAGGATTGAVSAGTGGNFLLDALLGAGLGAGAGYGGTRAIDHIRGRAPIPSETSGVDWQQVSESLPPDVVDQLLRAGVIGGSAIGAGYIGGKRLERIYRNVEGMASATNPFRGGVEGAAKNLSSSIGGGNPYHVMRDRARQVADAIAFEEMQSTTRGAADSWNPYKKWKALRSARRTVPGTVVERMADELGYLGGQGYSRFGGRGTGSKGVKEVLRSPGRSLNRAFSAGQQTAKGVKNIPRWGRWGMIPGAALTAYLGLKGSGDD